MVWFKTKVPDWIILQTMFLAWDLTTPIQVIDLGALLCPADVPDYYLTPFQGEMLMMSDV